MPVRAPPAAKGLNQAVVAARCGAEVRFCAPLGNDPAEANEVERHLQREGFAELILPRLPHATDFSLLMVLPGGETASSAPARLLLALAQAEAEPALQGLGRKRRRPAAGQPVARHDLRSSWPRRGVKGDDDLDSRAL